MEEAIIAGPIAGAITTPAAVGVGREQNRDLGTARRLAENYNRDLLANAPDTKDLVEGQIEIPTGKAMSQSLSYLQRKVIKQ